MNECVVCSEGGDGLVRVTESGKASLVEFSQLQQNDSVLIRVQNSEIVFVHEKCRKWYNNRKRINAVAKNNNEEERVPKAKTRKSEDSFSWLQTVSCVERKSRQGQKLGTQFRP